MAIHLKSLFAGAAIASVCLVGAHLAIFYGDSYVTKNASLRGGSGDPLDGSQSRNLSSRIWSDSAGSNKSKRFETILDKAIEMQIKNLNDKIGDAELNNDLATIIFHLSEPEISHTLLELIDRATAIKADDEMVLRLCLEQIKFGEIAEDSAMPMPRI